MKKKQSIAKRINKVGYEGTHFRWRYTWRRGNVDLGLVRKKINNFISGEVIIVVESRTHGTICISTREV